MIKKYKHIIWDWNGTILDDLELCVNVGNNLFRKKNIPAITTEKYKEVFTIPVVKYYEAVGFDFSKESFADIGKEWMDEYEERKYECKLHDDVQNVMRKIKDLGIEQSILSAYKENNLKDMVKHFNLDEYQSNIVGLDNIYAASKLDLGLSLMQKIGNGHGETLMIGDTVHDSEVAKAMGADCVLIADGHQNKETLLKCGVPVFDRLSEILKK
ncbi:MAG: HAD family hydrolase [Ignavibacteriae bacterium]|nr:HAD family hydrolase [Ignavibacteriota bacterium]